MRTIFIRSTGTALVISLTVLSGCNYKRQPKGIDPPVKVKIETVQESDEIRALDYVGIIEEKSSTALSFSTLGMIEEIYVSQGDYVSRGQLLAKIDPTSAQSILDAAEATLKQARDGYERLKSIHDKGSLPEIQMVDIETKLQQAQSSYNIAKKNLEDCSLYAPSEGVAGKRMAEPGEYSVVGKAVLTILDINSVKVKFSVSENEISVIPSDCKSIITVAALGNKEFKGERVVKGVTANVISHNYPAYIVLPNYERRLLPGMVCKVKLITDTESHDIVIPAGIIRATADGRKFVWGDKGGIATRFFVTTGVARGNGIEIISGLSAGDRIITEGYQKISEGNKITGQ